MESVSCVEEQKKIIFFFYAWFYYSSIFEPKKREKTRGVVFNFFGAWEWSLEIKMCVEPFVIEYIYIFFLLSYMDI